MLAFMAWRNLWRHSRRTLITAAAMAVSVAFVMGMLAYVDGMYRKMSEVMIDQATGHVQVAHPDYATRRTLYDTVPDAATRVAALEALPDLRASTARLYGFALLGGAEETAGAQLVGVLPDREQALVPMAERIVQGRWLEGDAARQIVLGAGLAETLRVAVGDQVVAVTQASDGSLGNELYEVVGVVTSGSVTLDRTGAWLSLPDLQALLVLPDQVHELIVLTDSRESRLGDALVRDAVERVRAAVAPTTAGAPEAPELLIRPWWEVSPTTASMMTMSDSTAWLMLAIVYSVAGLGVLNTMLMSVFERTRELGVMKALGTRPAVVIRLVLWESALLGGLAALGGLVLGGALDWYLVRYGLDLTVGDGERLSSAGVLFDPIIYGVVRVDRIVITVASVLVVAVLAALWPAVRAARLRPIDAMRQD
ncbi:ABC transporter permease [Myxococcota bacterium]|nr:ABC transporter permease [Myxococcota bacterium]